MNGAVNVVGIDAPNDVLFQRWLERGQLPNIRAIAEQGVSGNYTHTKQYRNERCWDIFLGGRNVVGSGSRFIAQGYDYFNESLQRESSYSPFYAVGESHRVCVFDVPATLSPHVRGIQVTGWGSELNAATPASDPPDLMAELVERYGSDPKLVQSLKVYDRKTGEAEKSYVVPSLYDPGALLRFESLLLTAVSRRTDICLDLLSRDDWDLFLALFPEGHTANHLLWHLGEDHPLRVIAPDSGHGQLTIFRAIDHAIGRIGRASGANTSLMVFTIDHGAMNTMDVPSMALLPELLYRWSFPGSQALAAGDRTRPVPAMRTDYRQHWKQEIWSLATAVGRQRLSSPSRQEVAGDALSWNPANWYKPLWPEMKAFALPSVGDGYIRLNVLGRESAGIITPGNFQSVRQQIEALLRNTTDPRTGRPLVKAIHRTRETPDGADSIPPDLIVSWDDSHPADALDSPELGRIGPLPYFRSGGHVAHGTTIKNAFFVRGPAFVPGGRTRTGKLEDMAATILHLMGAELSGQMTGRSLLDRSVLV